MNPDTEEIDDTATAEPETESPTAPPAIAPATKGSPAPRRRKQVDPFGDAELARPTIGQIPYQKALDALATGDPRGLEALYFTRASSGRPFVAFTDEHGEQHTLSMDDPTWTAALETRTRFRVAGAKHKAEQAERAQFTQEILETLAIAETPARMAGLVSMYAQVDPKAALRYLLDYEERRATRRPTAPLLGDIERALTDAGRRQRMALYTGMDGSNFQDDVAMAREILGRGNADLPSRLQAQRVLNDAETLESLQWDSRIAKDVGSQMQAGSQMGLVGYLMLGGDGWEQDGGPVQRAMALAERGGWAWTPIQRPRREADVEPYIRSMQRWAKSVLGWPAFVASPQELTAVATILGRADPRLDVEMALHRDAAAQRSEFERGPGGARDVDEGGGRRRETAQPEQAEQRAARAPEDLESLGVAGELFATGRYRFDPTAPPDEQQRTINSMAMELSRRGMKDPGQIKNEIRRFVDLSTRGAKAKAAQ